MDNLVKQRLVGALILVALATVFWPIIFVPNANNSEDLTVYVPEAPPVDLTPLSGPDSAGMRAGQTAEVQKIPIEDVLFDAVVDAGSDEQAEQEATDDANVEPASLPAREEVLPVPSLAEARQTRVSPAMDADGLPVAFSLQVATMGNKASAEGLRDELVNAGYKGYVKRLRRDDKMLYRVLVGPKYSRDELLPIKTAVDQTWRVESMIIRYLP